MQPLDAERVREWRHRRMLSQQEVADRAGTSLFTIQRIERGEGNVRPRTGRGVAAALGVPIEELLPKAQAPLPDFDVQERRAPVLVGPFTSGAYGAGQALKDFEGERREAISDLALAAARRQAKQDAQAAARAVESDRAQTYFMQHENEAAQRLVEYPADELAGAVLELARRCIQLEDFPAAQVAAFLAENERDNERIKQELKKLSANDIREMMLASPPLRRLSRAYAANEEKRQAERRARARPEAG